jgi:RNA polymerase sigma-70 factor (ECF subfamily)
MILLTTEQRNPESSRPVESTTDNDSPRQRDARLVSRFLAGDEDAFAEIMRLHTGKLFAVSFSVVRNPSDAEEIVQDTFVRAHRGLINFRGDSSLATWLYHIAFNLARNRYWYFYRRHRQDARSLEAVIGDQGLATFADLIADSGPDPAAEISHREFSASVQAGLKLLTPCQQEILIMRNFLDLSYNVIGAKLRINIGTVKSRIARARRNLKIIMLRDYPENSDQSTGSARNWFATSRHTGFLPIAR